MKSRHWMPLLIVLLMLAAVAFIVRDAGRLGGMEPELYRVRPVGIMGTTSELTVVAPRSRSDLATTALGDAEAALRNVEARMSRHLEASPISRLNAAPAGRVVELPADVMEMLHVSRLMGEVSDGAFDATCLPLLRAWKQAGQDKRQPSDEELAAAMALVGWQHFDLRAGGVRKDADGAGIDLGGIAKGYAVDQAAKAMQAAGIGSGIAQAGGDTRCFGVRPDGTAWIIGVLNPFDKTMLATLALRDAAVSTSGNYERYVEIDGKRYSHIVDPRTGRPAEMTPSVTVVAKTAVIADAWATALSVLGVDGLKRLKAADGVEAMIVVGGPDDYRLEMTDGFRKLMTEQPKSD